MKRERRKAGVSKKGGTGPGRLLARVRWTGVDPTTRRRWQDDWLPRAWLTKDLQAIVDGMWKERSGTARKVKKGVGQRPAHARRTARLAAMSPKVGVKVRRRMIVQDDSESEEEEPVVARRWKGRPVGALVMEDSE